MMAGAGDMYVVAGASGVSLVDLRPGQMQREVEAAWAAAPPAAQRIMSFVPWASPSIAGWASPFFGPVPSGGGGGAGGHGGGHGGAGRNGLYGRSGFHAGGGGGGDAGGAPRPPVFHAVPRPRGPPVPALQVLTSDVELDGAEARHLRRDAGASAAAGAPANGERLSLLFAYLADGTMAVEMALTRCLLQWPYLSDMSLASTATAVFLPGWRRPAAPAAPAGAPPPEDDRDPLEAWPWMYVNIVLRDSQVYVPLLSPHVRPCHGGPLSPAPSAGAAAAAAASAGAAAAGASEPRLFQRLAGTLLRQAAAPPGAARHPLAAAMSPHPGCGLEDVGLALTASAVRFGYFAGATGSGVSGP
jgi:hypothetical protein